jgi:hypothetical protein
LPLGEWCESIFFTVLSDMTPPSDRSRSFTGSA